MIYFLALLIYMIFTARASGGGFGAAWLEQRLKWGGLPEVLFGIPFGLTLFMLTDSTVLGVLGWVWSYAWMETGHGIWLRYGEPLPASDATRRQRLSPVVDWLADRFGIQKTLSDGFSPTNAYCWLAFGLKGLLIGLPAGGVLLAVFWPFCYQVGTWLRRRGVPFDPHAFAECLTGVFAAVTIALTWAVAS